MTSDNEFCPQHGYPLPCHKCGYDNTATLSPEWWKETDSIIRWNKDRVILLNQRINDLVAERDGLQRVVDFVDKLKSERTE